MVLGWYLLFGRPHLWRTIDFTRSDGAKTSYTNWNSFLMLQLHQPLPAPAKASHTRAAELTGDSAIHWSIYAVLSGRCRRRWAMVSWTGGRIEWLWIDAPASFLWQPNLPSVCVPVVRAAAAAHQSTTISRINGPAQSCSSPRTYVRPAIGRMARMAAGRRRHRLCHARSRRRHPAAGLAARVRQHFYQNNHLSVRLTNYRCSVSFDISALFSVLTGKDFVMAYRCGCEPHVCPFDGCLLRLISYVLHRRTA
jgi:hypothetical protein